MELNKLAKIWNPKVSSLSSRNPLMGNPMSSWKDIVIFGMQYFNTLFFAIFVASFGVYIVVMSLLSMATWNWPCLKYRFPN